MREIEFRGKDIKTKKWHYGSLINKYDADALCVSSSYIIEKYAFSISVDADTTLYDVVCLDDYYEVYENTVCQYTGLKDKNGTKIFEGDILTDNCCDRKCRFHIQGYVAFDEHWGYVLKMNPEDDGDTNWRFDAEKTLEVIGNIHDNKLEDFYE